MLQIHPIVPYKTVPFNKELSVTKIWNHEDDHERRIGTRFKFLYLFIVYDRRKLEHFSPYISLLSTLISAVTVVEN